MWEGSKRRISEERHTIGREAGKRFSVFFVQSRVRWSVVSCLDSIYPIWPVIRPTHLFWVVLVVVNIFSGAVIILPKYALSKSCFGHNKQPRSYHVYLE